MMKKLLPAVASSLLIALLFPAPVAAQKVEHDQANAAVTFQKRCASCHVVPDVSVRTDRAWLDQINRTT